MPNAHPIMRGLDEIARGGLQLAAQGTLFREVCRQIRHNWLTAREQDRWPSTKNWVLRVAPNFTASPSLRLEKQLQKQIAICLENEGWGNDVPTASGLVNSGGRQMNVDLAHRIPGGFELIELKVNSDTPIEAALQVLRYGALYLLYRTEPELALRFRHFEMMAAKRIVLEVLAPLAYYRDSLRELRRFAEEVAIEARCHARQVAGGLEMEFRFSAFPAGFQYFPPMNCALIREAVDGRRSPFAAC